MDRCIMESDSYTEILQRKLLVTVAHKPNMSHGVVAKQTAHYDVYKLMHYH